MSREEKIETSGFGDKARSPDWLKSRVELAGANHTSPRAGAHNHFSVP